MGVRGLTTFINSNSDVFFAKFKLHDCALVIDANSLAAVLYSETLGPYSAFGGDYDLFADHVETFVSNLKMCNIVPVFIFDGGYEVKKATTVRKRNAMKVFAIEKVSPDRPSRDFYPYLLRPVLQERLIELGVLCLQSDYEADREIAAIAKRLNAPVLSNDSDFFIFDVTFIPFSGFSFEICRKSTKSGETYNHMPCKIFYVENFLKSIGGMKKDMLPLLASVLGNDYLNRGIFKNFYGLIKKDKGKKMTLGKRRVCAFVRWLRNETYETALNKILSSLPKNRRQQVKNNINSVISGYADLSTCLDQYLPDISPNKLADLGCDEICNQLKVLDIEDAKDSNCESSVLDCVENNDEEELDIGENSQSEDSEGEDSNDDEEIENIVELEPSKSNKLKVPEWILERSRICQIAPQIITLLTLKTYFCVPQMEDCNMPHAGEIGFPIFQIIAGLTVGSRSITYWHRCGSNSYRKIFLEINSTLNNNTLPDLSALNEVSFEQRKHILLDTMNIEDPNLFDSFPEDWRLLIMCLIYWIKCKNALKSYHIHAVILMIIVVNIYQSKIGLFRKRRLFVKKYGAKVKNLEKIRENTTAKFNGIGETVNQELSKITIEDCLVSFENILPFFDVDVTLKERPRTFQRDLIHCFAELQTILDLAQSLNSLLLLPYKRIQISKFYNGTFLYNVTANFKRQRDIIPYLEKLYKRAPNLLNLHMSFFHVLSAFCGTNDLFSRQLPCKKRKKHKKKLHNNDNSIDTGDLSENTEDFHDENNKFSMLQGTTKL